MAGKLKIGISSCLLGHEVRWNGGHKLHKFLVYTLKRWRDILAAKPAMGALVDFHTRNKLLILLRVCEPRAAKWFHLPAQSGREGVPPFLNLPPAVWHDQKGIV